MSQRVVKVPYLKIKDACQDGYVYGELLRRCNFIAEISTLLSFTLSESAPILLLSDYGERVFTPYFVDLYNIDLGDFDDDYTRKDMFNQRVAQFLYNLYHEKWEKLYNTLMLEYDPIHNYLDEWEDESEGTENVDSTNTKTNNLTDTRTDNLTTQQTYSSNDSGANNVFGFNSATAVGADTNSGNESGNNTTNNTGTQTNKATGTVTDVLDKDATDSRNRSGRHSGNIGNITSQKMINEELELRKNMITKIVLEDCVGAVTVPVYF